MTKLLIVSSNCLREYGNVKVTRNIIGLSCALLLHKVCRVFICKILVLLPGKIENTFEIEDHKLTQKYMRPLKF